MAIITTAKADKDVEKLEYLYTATGDINWYYHFGKHFGSSTKY